MLPGVGERQTGVPGLTGRPLDLRAVTVMVEMPSDAMRLGDAEMVRTEPSGATGPALSQPASPRAATSSRGRASAWRIPQEYTKGTLGSSTPEPNRTPVLAAN